MNIGWHGVMRRLSSPSKGEPLEGWLDLRIVVWPLTVEIDHRDGTWRSVKSDLSQRSDQPAILACALPAAAAGSDREGAPSETGHWE